MVTALEELKESLKETMTPDDVVMGILSGLDTNSIPKDPQVLHRAIYDLKESNADNGLLQKFSFDTSGITPFSDLFDRVLFRLETANFLGTLNPRYAVYELKKEQLQKSLDKFSKQEKSVLEQMSRDFQNILGG